MSKAIAFIVNTLNKEVTMAGLALMMKELVLSLTRKIGSGQVIYQIMTI